jgi:transposase
MDIDRDTLYDLYVTRMMTMEEIGDIYRVHWSTVRNWLIALEIPIRRRGKRTRAL